MSTTETDTINMAIKAQAFMSTHKVNVCYECNGAFFKRERLAEASKSITGKPVIKHELSAGAATKKA